MNTMTRKSQMMKKMVDHMDMEEESDDEEDGGSHGDGGSKEVRQV